MSPEITLSPVKSKTISPQQEINAKTGSVGVIVGVGVFVCVRLGCIVLVGVLVGF